jgi:hypothetical protein
MSDLQAAKKQTASRKNSQEKLEFYKNCIMYLLSLSRMCDCPVQVATRGLHPCLPHILDHFSLLFIFCSFKSKGIRNG